MVEVPADHQFFSQKIKLPKHFVQNHYPRTTKSVQELLRLACLYCSDSAEKRQFEDYLNQKLLELSGTKKKVQVSLFTVDTLDKEAKSLYTIINKPLKVLPVKIGSGIFATLVDTGASASLMSVQVLNFVREYVNPNQYELFPINIDISCPTGVVRNAISGILKFRAQFWNSNLKLVEIPMHFLVSKTMGSWSVVLGNNVLMSESLGSTISASHITMNGDQIPIYSAPLGEFDGLLMMGNQKQDGGQSEILAVGALQDRDVIPCSQIIGRDPYVFCSNTITFHKQGNYVSSGIGIIGRNRESSHVNDEEQIKPFTVIGFFQFPKLSRGESMAFNNVKIETFPDQLEMPYDAEHVMEHSLTELPEIDILNLEEFTYENGDFSQCTSQQLQVLKTECAKFPRIFAKNKMDLGKTDYIKHHIQVDPLGDHKSQKQRHLGGTRLEFAKASIKVWEQMGIVSECENPRFKCNLILVPRNNGEVIDNSKAGKYHLRFSQNAGPPNYRLVVDHTSLNAITLNAQAPCSVLPETIVRKLMGKRVTKGDLSLAYYNIELTETSKPWTCFYLENSVYQFNRLSMGVNSAPSTFIKFISMVFAQDIYSDLVNKLGETERSYVSDFKGFQDFLVSYFDDFWIYTVECINVHSICVRLVFQALDRAGIKLSPKKCVYFANRVTVLGLEVDTEKEEMLMDIKKSISILSWPRPASLGEVSSRLHSLNYWTKFIPYLRYLLAPFYIMVKEGMYYWDEQTEICWAMAKAIMMADIRLSVPRPEDQLIMSSDASKTSCSQILFKRDGTGNVTIVSTSSRVFSSADQRREIHYKELISLCLGFKTFYQYFMASNKPIIVLVDAINLISIAREKDRNILASNLLSFVQKMCQAFAFNVFYLPSELNFLSNVFSRAFSTSRFKDTEYKFSKDYIKQVPRLDGALLNSNVLYAFLASELQPHPDDDGDKSKNRPKSLEECLQFYDGLSPEHCFTSALLLLKEVCRELTEADMAQFPDTAKLHVLKASKLRAKKLISKGSVSENGKLFQKVFLQLIDEIIEDTFGKSLPKTLKTKVRNALMENVRKMLTMPSTSITSIHDELEQIQKERGKALAGAGIGDFNQLVSVSQMGVVNAQKADMAQLHQTKPLWFETTEVKFILEGEFLPRVSSEGDCGIDLPIQASFTLLPGKQAKVDSGVRLLLPADTMGMIYKRSSAAKTPISIHMGVLDPSYVGKIFVLMRNESKAPITLNAGASIVQVVLHKVHLPALSRVQEFNVTSSRGCKGFGSSGNTLPVTEFNLQEAPLELELSLAGKIVVESGLKITLPEEEVKNRWVSPESDQSRSPALNNVAAFNFLTVYPITESNEQMQLHVMQTRGQTAKQANAMAGQSTAGNEEAALLKLVKAAAQADTSYLTHNKLNKEAFVQALKECPTFSVILQDLKDGKNHDKFELKQGLLFRNIQNSNKLCVPSGLMLSFIQAMHLKNNHDSKNHLENCFRKDFWHPSLEVVIRTFVQSCVTCKYTQWSFSKQNKGVGRSINPTKPRQYLSIDCIPKLMKSSDGYTSYTDILVIMDNYSFFVWAIPMQSRTAQSITKALLTFLADGQLPEVLLSDGETGLLAGIRKIQEYFPFMQTIVSPPFSAWQNSAEKAVGYIKKAMLKLIYNDHDPKERSDWVKLLPLAVSAINSSIIDKLGISRSELHFNRRVVGIFENSDMEALLNLALPDKTDYVHKIDPPTPMVHKYKEGNLVMLKQDAPPATGVNSAFIPKAKLELYTVTKVIKDSGNVHIACTITGQEKVAPVSKLILFSASDYISAYKKDLLPLDWHNPPPAKLTRKVRFSV